MTYHISIPQSGQSKRLIHVEKLRPDTIWADGSCGEIIKTCSSVLVRSRSHDPMLKPVQYPTLTLSLIVEILRLFKFCPFFGYSF